MYIVISRIWYIKQSYFNQFEFKMESETKSERFDGGESCTRGSPSNTNSIANNVVINQIKIKLSTKVIFGIIVNLLFGTAIIVNSFYWQLHSSRQQHESKKIQHKSINQSIALSVAIKEVKLIV